jgi:hypothetical protein
MEALLRLLGGVLLPLAGNAMKRGPAISGTNVLQGVIITLGVVCTVAFGWFLASFVNRRLVRYLGRKFGVNITVTGTRFGFNWSVDGGSPLKRFDIELLYWPGFVGVAAAAFIPLFLLYLLAIQL